MAMTAEQTALELRHITKLYSGTVALKNVDLTVRRGEVHGLIGKNGAGKSTLVGIISGLVTPSSGEIRINGHRFSSLSPITAKHQHISIITQEPQVVEESTVVENFFMPGYLEHRQMIDWKALRRKAAELLDKAGFPIDVSAKMGDLSISERQLMLVIKACFVEQAEIVIMDEVSASLSQKDQAILYRIIDNLTAEGKTVIFISHHTEELLRVCDRVTVIRNGQSVGSAGKAELDKKKLAALIVGDAEYNDEHRMEDLSSMVRPEVLFELKDFASCGKFRNISFSVRKGEIVGLAGLRGSGRTELMKSVVGIEPRDEGTLLVQGEEKRYRTPAAACNDGVLYMTEEREAEGLVAMASIQKNMTASILPALSRWGVLRSKKEETLTDGLIRVLDVKAFSRTQEISQLSGGNKQKVLVGKIMAHSPLVCLLDEPTRGVDIEAKESILMTINRELRKQSCVVITSPGVEDLIKICDRILVLYEGELIDRFSKDEFSEQQIYRAMQGEIIHNDEVKHP